MTGSDAVFPTFCHISEYGVFGYRSLHRLLAFSAPLNLWAPSSMLIRHASGIDAAAFINYVDQGLIRIHGRNQWITNRQWRDAHPWEYAAWDDQIDGALYSLWRAGQDEHEAAQRVVIAPDEEGESLAAEYLDTHPDQIGKWYKVITSKSAESKLPPGTLESARRKYALGPVAVATAILRDAYNHGLALGKSGADVPLLLTPADRRFLKLLDESWQADMREVPPNSRQPMLPSDLAGQLLEILRNLDIHRGPQNLDQFLAGTGHRLLVAWLSDLCRRYRDAEPRKVDGVVLKALRRELNAAAFTSPVRDALLHPFTTAGGLVGFGLAAAGCVVEPDSPLGIAGMAAAVAQVAPGIARQFGVLPSIYSGPQWPFLYTYRSAARRKQVENLRYILSEIASN